MEVLVLSLGDSEEQEEKSLPPTRYKFQIAKFPKGTNFRFRHCGI